MRAKLVGVVLLAITPAWLLLYLTNLPWLGFAIGLLALAAAWAGGELFVLRQLRSLLRSAQNLAAGKLEVETGLTGDLTEMGELARRLETLSRKLRDQSELRDQQESSLQTRALQQTVVSALGQFAMASEDAHATMHQVVQLVTQTLELEFSQVLELSPGAESLLLRAGVGWKSGLVGNLQVRNDPGTQPGFTLRAGEPVLVENMPAERRFRPPPLLIEHGIVSGLTVRIGDHTKPFGVLGAFSSRPRQFNEHEVHFLLALANVIQTAVQRAQTEAKLQKLAAFAQQNPNPVMELSADGQLTYFNDAAMKLAVAVRQNSPRKLLPENVAAIIRGCLAARASQTNLQTQADGRTLAWAFHPVAENRVVHAYVEDITARLALEAQFRQSQKMESIGQLAAGIAHDFNNMLTVIQGHASMLLNREDLPPPIRTSTQAILFAAERAAGLTRQLLVFSRKGAMQAKPLDLGEVVTNLGKMLSRLLGESIKLELEREPALPSVCGDAGMLEQVLMNLVINARDAMPEGGWLRIRVARQVVPEGIPLKPNARPGAFVTLKVTDTGCGMDAATQARIFEPFFTTKEVGKGTGLGLATVYGIVRQHQGWIEVASEPGKGTTFEVFFPASEATAAALGPVAQDQPRSRRGSETILLVEDEAVLRDLATVILQDCGYEVIPAGSGPEALRIWQDRGLEIDLLLSDMALPDGLSGTDLAEKLQAVKPALKVIFASGYSVDEINHPLLKDKRAAFIQKPYTHHSLTTTVREWLDAN